MSIKVFPSKAALAQASAEHAAAAIREANGRGVCPYGREYDCSMHSQLVLSQNPLAAAGGG